MSTFVFPGQGSQKYGMGAELFSEFASVLQEADDILGYSLEELCLRDPHGQLNETAYTQPAIYTINALSYMKRCTENPKIPNYLAGHSLGEYNALNAAGVFDFETGLKLVKKRGELMNKAEGGAMAAIIGLREEEFYTLFNQNELKGVTIANKNSRTQIVISGGASEVNRARILCEQNGAILAIQLNVSGAFHSPHMLSAQQEFKSFLDGFHFKEPTIPVIANCTARPYLTSEEDIKNTLSAQITQPVLWTQSIEYLLEQGETEFIELGPGKILTGLIQRIKNGQ